MLDCAKNCFITAILFGLVLTQGWAQKSPEVGVQIDLDRGLPANLYHSLRFKMAFVNGQIWVLTYKLKSTSYHKESLWLQKFTLSGERIWLTKESVTGEVKVSSKEIVLQQLWGKKLGTINDIALTSDGKIVVVGLARSMDAYGFTTIDNRIIVAKFNELGQADRSFNGRGYEVIPPDDEKKWQLVEPRGVFVSNIGEVLLLGSKFRDDSSGPGARRHYQCFVIQIRGENRFVKFEKRGIRSAYKRSNIDPFEVIAGNRGDHAYFLGAVAKEGHMRRALFKISSDGRQMDKNFGEQYAGAGISFVDLGGFSATDFRISKVASDHNGRLVVGQAKSDGNVSLKRYHPNGQKDASFFGGIGELGLKVSKQVGLYDMVFGPNDPDHLWVIVLDENQRRVAKKLYLGD